MTAFCARNGKPIHNSSDTFSDALKKFSFAEAHCNFSKLACKELTGYKLGEALSDGLLTNKLVLSFVGGLIVDYDFITSLSKDSVPIFDFANGIATGLGSAALTYIWHEDSDASEMDQMSSDLAQSI